MVVDVKNAKKICCFSSLFFSVIADMLTFLEEIFLYRYQPKKPINTATKPK